MANIWPVYEGKAPTPTTSEPTVGGPWAHLPLREAAQLFELGPEDRVSDITSTPRFGDVDRDVRSAGFKYIVVEVGRNEAKHAPWKPGFYKSKVPPKEAFSRLIKHALAEKLGEANVIDVKYEPTIDSLGREALKITVVIPEGAARRLANGAALDALVGLQARLREMREERPPIIEYATEAELQPDAGPQP